MPLDHPILCPPTHAIVTNLLVQSWPQSRGELPGGQSDRHAHEIRGESPNEDERSIEVLSLGDQLCPEFLRLHIYINEALVLTLYVALFPGCCFTRFFSLLFHLSWEWFRYHTAVGYDTHM